jgi:hypothetical protein
MVIAETSQDDVSPEIRAFPSEEKVAQQRNVLMGAYRVIARGATRARRDEVVAFVPWRRLAFPFGALCLPLALHHLGEPMDDNVQKAADGKPEQGCQRNEGSSRAFEQGYRGHRSDVRERDTRPLARG